MIKTSENFSFLRSAKILDLLFLIEDWSFGERGGHQYIGEGFLKSLVSLFQPHVLVRQSGFDGEDCQS